MNLRAWLVVSLAITAIGIWRLVTPAPLQQDDPRLHTGTSDIVMLAADWCGYCRKQQAAFEKAGVRYTWLDVETAKGAAAMQAVGGRGVPVTIVGQEVVHGYQPQRLHALLQPLGYPDVFR